MCKLYRLNEAFSILCLQEGITCSIGVINHAVPWQEALESCTLENAEDANKVFIELRERYRYVFDLG